MGDHRLFWVLLIVVSAWVHGVASAQLSDQVFLFPFFKDSGQNGVYLAWSEDGRTFNVLNDGNPVFTPPQWTNQNLTRDPSIVYQDGTFHMVWTSHWEGSIFGYARSTDMKSWSTPKQVAPFANVAQQPFNVWAPEIHYDTASSSYFIVWASAPNSSSDKKQYYTRTSDFESFTDAEVFFYQGWSVIDSHAAYDDRGNADAADDRWVMIVKNEEGASSGGKNLRMTTYAGDIDWDNYDEADWSTVTGPVAGPGGSVQSNMWAEGATLLKNGDEWLLYWDAYTSPWDYGMASSTDLVNWINLTSQFHLYDANGSEITHPRHGTVFLAPRSALTAFDEIPQAPEPQSLVVAALGVTAMAVRRRRRA